MFRWEGKTDALHFAVSLEPQLRVEWPRLTEFKGLSLSLGMRRVVAELAECQDDSQQADLYFS